MTSGQSAGDGAAIRTLHGTAALNGRHTEKMPRRYIHSTAMSGATGATDTARLRDLVTRAARLGMTPQEFKEDLAVRTGFGDAVRSWFREEVAPNGLIRRIILNNAEDLVGSERP